MSIKALADYTQYAKYARYNKDKQRRETWAESVERVFDMHKQKLGDRYEELKDDFDFAKSMMLKKKILGSQRALQFGGSPILKKEAKIYNCCASYVDRLDFFKECEYLLLCGCGVGASIQWHHVDKLPKVVKRNKGKKEFVIPDTIEGWSDAVSVLINSFFDTKDKVYSYDMQFEYDSFSGYEVEFNYSMIRPKGAEISWGGIAPGPDGLKHSLDKIAEHLTNITEKGERKLKPIEVYDIIMHMSDSVLSGGIRRSACIVLFSADDKEMSKAKTGDWFRTNPQRARSNNSAILVRDDTPREQFSELMDSVKSFGEPGFIWTDNKETLYNPCVTKDTMVFTSDGIKPVEELIGKQFTAVVNGEKYESTERGFFFTGNKSVFELQTNEGLSIKATENHKFLVIDDGKEVWKELKTIDIGDSVVVQSRKEETENNFGVKTTDLVISKTPLGNEDVYDCTIEDIHAFDANGFYAHNCSEISFVARDEDGNSGWAFCNLSEINGKKCKTEEDFYEACKAASILGTIQATYTNFDYLSPVTKNIVERDALLGVSITGMMDNPEIIFNKEIQRKGSKIVLETNERIAKSLGINSAARATAIKPSGTASCILGSSSGIHPSHAKKYIRRVQANKLEFPAAHFQTMNPLAVEESVWSNTNTDVVISFLCEVPQGAITKNKISAIEMLEYVKLTQQNWIEYGTRKNDWRFDKYGWLRHNVSNTISVKEEEWDEVESYIYRNRKWFAGISLLPMDGDKDYPQAPFTTIYEPQEIVKYYGEGSMLASGLVVDGLHAFNNNLWTACDSVLGLGEPIEDIEPMTEPTLPEKNGYTQKQWNEKLVQFTQEHSTYLEHTEKYEANKAKLEWIRRVKQFADRYVGGDVRKCCYLLKDISNWKLWLDLNREYKNIDWSQVVEEREERIDVSTISGEACSGPNGTCETGTLGAAINNAKQNQLQ